MSAATGAAVSLWSLDPAAYQPHRLHHNGRNYVETNCYVDVLIELLHARGDEPTAMLGSILRLDWEGDQFTYFKPRLADLERLYGVEIHEMLPYQSLPEQIARQLRLGRTMLFEADAWYLPDTAATSYRREHLKTTVAPETIDTGRERLRYFHNAGFFELEGEDYRGVFHRLAHFSDDVMDPFVELVDFDAGPRLVGDELRGAARGLLSDHFARRPADNPFVAWGEQLKHDLPRLLRGDPDDYHAYAFLTVRMVGSAFELLADHVDWTLGDAGAEAGTALRRIVDGSKVLSFRLARRRAFDPGPVLADLANAYAEGVERLRGALT